MSHRRGLPKPSASERTWRRFRIRHAPKPEPIPITANFHVIEDRGPAEKPVTVKRMGWFERITAWFVRVMS